ncbi:hypothetical protein GDO78_003065 [Eleutherodactylus coqui]|uniref:C-type lectin domain-containing protein n=1 Tax=Eleutherodactylus coqui TaxID=57060 RepID=A0A8J6EVR0_ELECQ|nr:hypothetical protein GDO78_003065 [Eleutherodactylus coqui]
MNGAPELARKIAESVSWPSPGVSSFFLWAPSRSRRWLQFDCQSYGHGAHLASILDAAEADIIGTHISAQKINHPVWIGLHDPEQNRRWKWTDGSTYNYRSWLRNQPDNYHQKEYCVELSCIEKFQTWNDAICNQASPYVCKFKP